MTRVSEPSRTVLMSLRAKVGQLAGSRWRYERKPIVFADVLKTSRRNAARTRGWPFGKPTNLLQVETVGRGLRMSDDKLYHRDVASGVDKEIGSVPTRADSLLLSAATRSDCSPDQPLAISSRSQLAIPGWAA